TERDRLPRLERDRIIGKRTDAQLWALQVDEDADRSALLGFDRANRLHERAQLVVRRVAHVDAENVGAGLEQPRDDRLLGGSRPERRHDLGPAQPSHWPGGLAPPGSVGVSGVTWGSARSGVCSEDSVS